MFVLTGNRNWTAGWGPLKDEVNAIFGKQRGNISAAIICHTIVLWNQIKGYSDWSLDCWWIKYLESKISLV